MYFAVIASRRAIATVILKVYFSGKYEPLSYVHAFLIAINL